MTPTKAGLLDIKEIVAAALANQMSVRDAAEVVAHNLACAGRETYMAAADEFDVQCFARGHPSDLRDEALVRYWRMVAVLQCDYIDGLHEQLDLRVKAEEAIEADKQTNGSIRLVDDQDPTPAA